MFYPSCQLPRFAVFCAITILPLGLLDSWMYASEVRLEPEGDTVRVSVDGAPFTVYNYSKLLPKPFFAPVQAADGRIVTRGFENPDDHPHHKGIWLAIDQVNQIEFW